MTAYNLLCEGMKQPLGIDYAEPRLSWKMDADRRNSKQAGYRIIVSTDEAKIAKGEGDVLDSGRVETRENAHILKHAALKSATRYFWSVQIWDDQGIVSEFAPTEWWETGLTAQGDWRDAQWIEPAQPAQFETAEDHVDFNVYPDLPDTDRFVPCQLLRKDFELSAEIQSARAYATAHGVYQLEINGAVAGELVLAPEPTPYDKFLQYQTYDVTGLLRSGRNAIGIHLAPGWWSGIIGLYSASCQYGDRMAALVKLVVQYKDGKVQEIVSDDSFVGVPSPIRYAEIFVGEKYDGTCARPGWSEPGYDASGWESVRCVPYPKEEVLRGQNAEPIRVCDTLRARRVFTTPAGERMIDFGQVLAGKAHIEFTGTPGAAVTFHHTEELDKEGNYARNVSGPYNQSTDTYIIGPDGRGVYEPKFVYHGFRYIMVKGDAAIDESSIFALVIHSDVSRDGSFECSDDRVTQLQRNIHWTLLGNFVAIPTDNPDRERAGWTGDAQMIVETACYNLGLQAFWRRWLEEMRHEQRADGQIPHIVPDWKSYRAMSHHKGDTTSSAWGDACILLPWTIYLRYGDKRILEENYEMMARWLAYVRHTAETKNPDDIGRLTREREERLKYIWNTGYHYGDWLTPSDCVDGDGNFQYLPRSLPLSDFTPSCYFAQSAELMSRIAGVLGKRSDAQRYAGLAQKVRAACAAELFGEDGLPKEDRQGAQVFSLFFGIAPEGCEERILAHLLDMIDRNGGRMDTGFSSTQYLLNVLTDRGAIRQAYDRLFCTEPPSWLYEVEKGATAIWESWQGIMPDGTVNPVSFSQYANGCIGNWLFSTVAGIREDMPGFSKIRICPETDDRLDFVRASYESVHGTIRSEWEAKDGGITVAVEIPANTEAVVLLPHAAGKAVLESGKELAEAEGVLDFRETEGKIEVRVGSGNYRFVY